MNRFLRKNQKKLMAVFAVFLMIVFIITLNPRGMNTGQPAVSAGTLNGHNVDRTDLVECQEEWSLLSQLQYSDPNDPRNTGPLLIYTLGEASQHISPNTPTFYLLKYEALQRGLAASDEEVQSILKNNVPDIPTDVSNQQVEDAIRDALTVRNLIEQASDAIKITRPLRKWEISRIGQRLTLNVASFEASHYLPKVSQPTQAEIDAQFNKLRDTLPGQYGSDDSPLGFGYKMPTRVKVQYLGISQENLLHAAQASKSEQDWYVQAYNQYQSHRDAYDNQQVVVPATEPSAATRLSRPQVRKLENVQADWELHASLVLTSLYEQEANRIEKLVERKISDSLSTGYGSWRDSGGGASTNASTEPSTVSSSDYISSQFMFDLAQSIHDQFGVECSCQQTPTVMTADQLQTLPGIGNSLCQGPDGRQWIPFAHYATLLKPELPDDVAKAALGRMALSEWQPSQTMQTYTGDLYFFRISQIDLAHQQQLADVKDQVIADCKMSAAYDMARKAAQKLVDDSKTKPFMQLAQSAGAFVVKTEPFVPYQYLSPSQDEVQQISPLQLKPYSVESLAHTAQQLLSAPLSFDQRPVQLAQLYADDIAAAVHLDSTQSTWGSEFSATAEGTIISQTTIQQRNALMADYCSYDAVAQRVGFKSASDTSQPSP